MAEHQRTNTVRVPKRIEGVLADEHHGVAALDEVHSCSNTGAQTVCTASKVADKLGCYLGIRVRSKGNLARRQFFSQRVKVDEGTVVRQGDEGLVDGRHVRLSGLPTLGARSAVAAVTNSHFTRHCVEIVVIKNFSYEARIFSDKHGLAITDSYTCRILSAMLQRVQRKISESSNVTVRRPYSKDATFLVKFHWIPSGCLSLSHP